MHSPRDYIVWEAINLNARCRYDSDVDVLCDDSMGYLHEICEYALAMRSDLPIVRRMNASNRYSIVRMIAYKNTTGFDALNLYFEDWSVERETQDAA